MSREVLIPILFIGVVVLRLTMMLVMVPQGRRVDGRPNGADPRAPAADQEQKESAPSESSDSLAGTRAHAMDRR